MEFARRRAADRRRTYRQSSAAVAFGHDRGLDRQRMFEAHVRSQQLPEKVPSCGRRSPCGSATRTAPISVVGASRIGGELASDRRARSPTFLLLLAALNFFVGIFNLCRCCRWTAGTSRSPGSSRSGRGIARLPAGPIPAGSTTPS